MSISENILIAYSLALRDIRNTYARTFFGPLWMVATPIMMLLVYWCVFSVILGIEWKSETDNSKVPYIVPFFIGLSIYLFLADIITSSLKVYVAKRAYIQRTPVPLWVIWLSNYFRSLFQFSASVFVLVVILSVFGYASLFGFAFALLVLLVFALMAAAVSLLFATLGPFFGDIENTVGPIMRAVFYSAPITYPLTFVPAPYDDYLLFNPLSIPATEIRRAIIDQNFPSSLLLGYYLLASLILFLVAYALHRRLKKVVPDVV